MRSGPGGKYGKPTTAAAMITNTATTTGSGPRAGGSGGGWTLGAVVGSPQR